MRLTGGGPAGGGTPAPAGPAASRGAGWEPAWTQRYSFYLVLLDTLALGLAGIVAVFVRFGFDAGRAATYSGFSYLGIALVLVGSWLAVLGLSRCYETRFLGTPEEFRRVGNASVRVAAVVALTAFAADVGLSRGFTAVFLVSGTSLLLLDRAVARAVVRRGRRQGRFRHRVLVLGGPVQAQELVRQLSGDPASAFDVVGVCLPGGTGSALPLAGGGEVPVLGGLSSVSEALAGTGADTLAVAASPGITAESLRRLAYELEATGVDLLVAPALTNVTGTRVSIRPMAGLPLLHVDEPELSGARKAVKRVFDVVVAGLSLLVLAPVLVGIAALIRLTSRGPAFFRQARVGRAGRTFTLWKYRSMYLDAEQRLAEIRHLNEHDGVLFKMRDDPRVTPIGRWLRRYSLDELPQLVNVLRGDMSLVGPRPPLPEEVARYEGHAHRRLLVKPGITGLWQVSGRSDLSWEETVRLDLQYVENWSLGLDITVLARTAVAVVRSSGAY